MKKSLLVLMLFLLAAPVEAAQNLPVSAFVGTYSGGGVAENRDSLYFAITVRDFDVVIRRDGAGFTVNWTTVLRQGGNPSKPDIRRKSTTMSFRPAQRPGGGTGLFRAEGGGDPLDGKQYGWARVKEKTLTVYLMDIGQDGTYQMQSYARTLQGTGMTLTYTRLRDGDRVRIVKGRLVKTGR